MVSISSAMAGRPSHSAQAAVDRSHSTSTVARWGFCPAMRANANIQAGVQQFERSAIKVSDGAEVTFVLSGFSTIAGSAKTRSCGIEVGYDSKVTFEGEGTLNVTGGEFGAAIGSYGTGTNIDFEERAKVGEITINNGYINAFAGRRGSGIGSGYHVSGNKIVINGGVIHAYGTQRKAPIRQSALVPCVTIRS